MLVADWIATLGRGYRETWEQLTDSLDDALREWGIVLLHVGSAIHRFDTKLGQVNEALKTAIMDWDVFDGTPFLASPPVRSRLPATPLRPLTAPQTRWAARYRRMVSKLG